MSFAVYDVFVLGNRFLRDGKNACKSGIYGLPLV
jgi:hypothetical protein